MTSPATVAPTSPLKAAATFRPWGIDTLATIERVTDANVTLVYDHEPTVKHTIAKRELSTIGRIVNRGDYR